jgi:tetratricopeptide (TPR) repeat protein
MSKKHWEEYFNAIRQQNWEQAKTSLEHLCDIEQNNPQVHLKLGDIHQRIGNTPQAITAYHRSAWILKNQGFIQKALALYKIILRLDSYNDEALKLSKELMIQIESSKKQKTAAPYFEGRFEEEKPEAEVGLPLGLEEEKAEQEAGKRDEETIYIPSLFTSLPPDEMIEIIRKIPLRAYSSAQVIIEEGDSGDSLYLIKSGSAQVITHILGREIELAILSPGDVFGEIAFLTGRPRTASVIALEKIEVMELDKVLLEEIFERYPDILIKMHDFYYSRVQDTLEKVKSKLKK